MHRNSTPFHAVFICFTDTSLLQGMSAANVRGGEPTSYLGTISQQKSFTQPPPDGFWLLESVFSWF
jgi:hypothetical protein